MAHRIRPKGFKQLGVDGFETLVQEARPHRDIWH
jgi:hypothetical protein